MYKNHLLFLYFILNINKIRKVVIDLSIKKYKFTKENSFKINEFKTKDKGEFKNREEAVEEFVSNLKEIHLLQQNLYAERKESVVFVFQAMDAAGKDGTIRTVFSTLSPHGVKEFCFKAPSVEELSHDYLWRFWSALPSKGHISIFNRSYYEDVLVGKVHKLYENQLVPNRLKSVDVITKRYKEINDFERYLYNNGTRVIKIFLNVSKEEQAKRFISRIDTPRKNWKISEGDIKEREYWDEYQEAFESMVNKTSCKTSPWYVVPADHKWYARLIVSRIVLNTLKEINPQFPTISDEQLEKVQAYRDELVKSLNKDTKKESKNKDKKDKKHKEKKEDKKVYDELPDDVKEEMESVFVNASAIVTDGIIEEEQEKVAEKEKESTTKNIDEVSITDVKFATNEDDGIANHLHEVLQQNQSTKKQEN